ncbi:hypothetical protein RCL1_002567 [Eukaryota sp. TZLM3-RCL]
MHFLTIQCPCYRYLPLSYLYFCPTCFVIGCKYCTSYCLKRSDCPYCLSKFESPSVFDSPQVFCGECNFCYQCSTVTRFICKTKSTVCAACNLTMDLHQASHTPIHENKNYLQDTSTVALHGVYERQCDCGFKLVSHFDRDQQFRCLVSSVFNSLIQAYITSPSDLKPPSLRLSNPCSLTKNFVITKKDTVLFTGTLRSQLEINEGNFHDILLKDIELNTEHTLTLTDVNGSVSLHFVII